MTIWTGRRDSAAKERFFHYVTEIAHVEKVTPGSVCLCGFAVDRGVARNQGRVGAAEGPDALRRQLANLCVPSLGDIWDLGNLVCDGDELESAQEKLGEWVQGIIEAGAFPVILGGGHETAWGTYQGIGRVEGVAKSLGIVNLDAHFDLRPVEDGKGTSGTPFSQIASACEKVRRSFHYTCVGIQSSGNTESLFSRAKEVGASYHLAEACIQDPERVVRELAEKMATVQNVYVSFCLDVIHASVAPGVSAPQGLGLFPWQVEPMLTWLIHSGKMVAFDMVELAPRFDPQGSTVRFAAEWVRKVVMGYFSQANGR